MSLRTLILTISVPSVFFPVHVIVATPGRLLDLLEKGIANASQCHMLVLDEADKLLSMDYHNSLDKLIGFLPSDRQVLLFSATFPVTIRGFTVSQRHTLHHPSLLFLLSLLLLLPPLPLLPPLSLSCHPHLT